MELLILVFVSGIASLAFALYLSMSVLREKQGTAKMIEISEAIQTGAMHFSTDNIGPLRQSQLGYSLFCAFLQSINSPLVLHF